MTIDELERLKAQGKQRTAVALAACSLACRRHGYRERQRVRRIYTGRLEGRRAFRGEAVILPDNSLAFVQGVRRGVAAIWKHAPLTVGEREYTVVNTDGLRRYKLPSAVLLGAQKSGKRERKSQRKLKACRRNGSCPCRRGRRGRPRKPFQPTRPDAHQSLPPTGPMPGTPYPLDFLSCVRYYSRQQAPQSSASMA